MFRIKKVLWAILLLLLFCATFFIGGIVGFDQGYAYSVFHRSSLEAYFTLRTLESLNAGKAPAANELLEGRLDSHITDHYVGLHSKFFISFNKQPHNNEAISKIMGQVAAYRKDHPSREKDPEAKKGIDTVISRYTNK